MNNERIPWAGISLSDKKDALTCTALWQKLRTENPGVPFIVAAYSNSSIVIYGNILTPSTFDGYTILKKDL
jgi:hypothetical protein